MEARRKFIYKWKLIKQLIHIIEETDEEKGECFEIIRIWNENKNPLLFA